MPATTAPAQTVALITGANKGIGLATARRLAERGWQVLLGSRDPELGAAAVAELGAGLAVAPLVLDVTSDESVTAAAEYVRERWGRLDVLINNAGVAGDRLGPLETEVVNLLDCYTTNVFGPVRVTNAFLPLLRRSPRPRIVMVSSARGSFGVTGDPGRMEGTLVSLSYPTSKAALNMMTTMYAKALPEFRVNAVDPGFTATDMNGHIGVQTVEEGADALVDLATVGPAGPTGQFHDRFGRLSW